MLNTMWKESTILWDSHIPTMLAEVLHAEILHVEILHVELADQKNMFIMGVSD